MRSRTVLITLAALAGSASAGAASARLEWKDLDLSTEAGRAELDQRIGVVAGGAFGTCRVGCRRLYVSHGFTYNEKII